jgi:hypothetical protein
LGGVLGSGFVWVGGVGGGWGWGIGLGLELGMGPGHQEGEQELDHLVDAHLYVVTTHVAASGEEG